MDNIDCIINKNTLNDWLGKNTKRNSFFTWEYKNKIYTLDEIRIVWEKDLNF